MRVARAAALLAAALCQVEDAAAAPVFTRAVALPGGGVLFPDAREAQVFHYFPMALRVAERDGRPQFFFYKSEGASLTGTMSTPAARGGVITVTLALRDPGEEDFARWREVVGRDARFRLVPVAQAVGRLHVKRLLPDRPPDGADKPLVEAAAPWETKAFRFSLDMASATLLWKELEARDNLALMADVEVKVPGFEITDGADGRQQFTPAERVHRVSAVLPVSRASHPDCFEIVRLAEKISFETRALRIFCFDFSGDLTPGLERVVVEARVTTPRGQTQTRMAAYAADTEPAQTLTFDALERRGSGYRYRVARLYTDGKREQGEWKTSDDAVLDVTVYEIADRRSGGAR